MRPYRIGTSSGTRVFACSSSSSSGERRSGGGSQAACEERGTSARAAFPRAAALADREVVDARRLSGGGGDLVRF